MFRVVQSRIQPFHNLKGGFLAHSDVPSLQRLTRVYITLFLWCWKIIMQLEITPGNFRSHQNSNTSAITVNMTTKSSFPMKPTGNAFTNVRLWTSPPKRRINWSISDARTKAFSRNPSGEISAEWRLNNANREFRALDDVKLMIWSQWRLFRVCHLSPQLE